MSGRRQQSIRAFAWLSLIFILPATAGAQHPPYLIQGGSSGSGDGQFSRSLEMALSASEIDEIVTCVEPSSSTLTVAGDANIFGAGHVSPPNPGGGSGGTPPPVISFPPGAGKTATFPSVTGMVAMTVSFGMNGPDGTISYSSNLSSWDGISGIRADRVGFLAGVFVDANEPTGSGPTPLDFGPTQLGVGFMTLSPSIGQTFYIGDGLTGTGTGAVQVFEVPPTASNLYLGFADGNNYAGPPGQYQDNAGLLTVDVSIECKSVSAVPEVDTPSHELFTISNNPLTTGNAEIRFIMRAPDVVEIRVFDVAGGLKRNLKSSWFDTGEHRLLWDGTDEDGQALANGLYFVQVKLTESGEHLSRRIVILR